MHVPCARRNWKFKKTLKNLSGDLASSDASALQTLPDRLQHGQYLAIRPVWRLLGVGAFRAFRLVATATVCSDSTSFEDRGGVTQRSAANSQPCVHQALQYFTTERYWRGTCLETAAIAFVNPLKCSGVRWSHWKVFSAIQVWSTILISDIRALWHSRLSATVPHL